MICKECGCKSFEESYDGYTYCNQCSTKADDIIGTADNPEDFIGQGGDTRGAMYNPSNKRLRQLDPITPSQQTQETKLYSEFRSKLKSASQKTIHSAIPLNTLFPEPVVPEDFPVDTSLSYEDYYQEVRDRYVQGFLMMITCQCDALVERFNVTPLIIDLVGAISLRFVALSGVFEENWADNAIHESENQLEETEETDERENNKKKRNRDKSEPENLYGKRAVMIWVRELRNSLPLSSSLAISFLACHKAAAPVLPTDILRWARQGKIPYRSCFLKIQKQMGEKSAACPIPARVMFKPHKIITAQVLEARAAMIADNIGLPLPPVNFYGIASNYLNRLSIPEDKLLDVVSLIRKWSMPTDLYLSKNEFRLPTRVCVMSILVVAIRMLYNINGFGVWEKSLGLVDEPNSPELSDFTKETQFDDTEKLLKNLETRYYEVSDETVGSEECEKDMLSYLSHGKNVIFTGLKEASNDDTYRNIDHLWNSCPKDEEFDGFKTPSNRGRDYDDDDLPLNQMSIEDDDDKLSDGNNPCTSHDKERAMRRLITDMGDNFFTYIPPRVKVKRLDYLQYVRKKEDGALVYAAHSDYYILLRVCARVAEIDVRNMHRGVLSFERRLIWIEKRIDQVLRLNPPKKTCKLCCDKNKVETDKDQGDDMVL